MSLWARVVLGVAGLGVFTALAFGDARALQARRGVPVTWSMAAIGATVLAGFVHLALTPEHWDQSVAYGLLFLAAGAVQLCLASLLARPASARLAWDGAIAANLAFAFAYVQTRVFAPLGSELPRSVDAIGLVTVAAELIAAAVGVLTVRRHLPRPAARR
ncbi:MAG: hypothetical protein M3144_11535 [Actinomycetota bacterium]|nr:hypothetical protein [Actinomycetota bacterium]